MHIFLKLMRLENINLTTSLVRGWLFDQVLEHLEGSMLKYKFGAMPKYRLGLGLFRIKRIQNRINKVGSTNMHATVIAYMYAIYVHGHMGRRLQRCARSDAIGMSRTKGLLRDNTRAFHFYPGSGSG